MGKSDVQKNIVYQTKNGAIELRSDRKKETLWATQKEIATVFDMDIRTINEHVSNIYKSRELGKSSTIRKFRIVQKEGKRLVERNTDHYNLDMIISVGYRVNSKTATQFRKWATKTLKQHITQGYTINPKMVKHNYENFLSAVEKVQKLLPKDNQIPTEDVLDLVKTFAQTWVSLESYDEKTLPTKGYTKKQLKIESKDLYAAVENFKHELQKKEQATSLFAQERKIGNLEGILGNVSQHAFGKEMYSTVEEKAAHLLYFIVKNHPFTDGNKRTGAFSFLWFLQRSKVKFYQKITPETLTAITLLIAQSNPKEKEQMVGLVLLLLKK